MAGCSHISRFIAGAYNTGLPAASRRVESRSSANPCAARAMVCAVAGATTMRSAARANSICAMALGTRTSHRSVNTGRPDKAWKVASPTKRLAASVSTTCTVAPALTSSRVSSADLYAATPPVTARRMCLPWRSIAALRRPGAAAAAHAPASAPTRCAPAGCRQPWRNRGARRPCRRRPALRHSPDRPP
ncbi:hypothetical protein GALL_530670 [mine drainage metagenome]|uniref:Uncharacterized protein n=1 Tax=mine drainage metagenome TaxID=410659 RepID=A0A1J5P2M0_9ZZZZ